MRLRSDCVCCVSSSKLSVNSVRATLQSEPLYLITIHVPVDKVPSEVSMAENAYIRTYVTCLAKIYCRISFCGLCWSRLEGLDLSVGQALGIFMQKR
jgi:hypothetical protein